MRLPWLLGRTETGPQDGAVEGILADYADTLSPDRATLDRGRAVMLAALAERERATRAAMIAVAPPGDGVDPTGPIEALGFRPVPRLRPAPAPARPADHRPYRLSSRRPKLAAAFAAAAMVVLATIGVAAETGPGQPFYRFRLGVEAIGLPPAGSTARAEADLSRAQARLDEISGEATHGDWSGADDAAAAYADVINSLPTPGSGATDPYRASLLAQLHRLIALRTDAHGDDARSLDDAIARLQSLLGLGPSVSPTPSGGGDDGNGGDDQGTGGGSGSRPHATHSPGDAGDSGSGDGAGASDQGGHGDGSATPTPGPHHTATAQPTACPTPQPSGSGPSWHTGGGCQPGGDE